MRMFFQFCRVVVWSFGAVLVCLALPLILLIGMLWFIFINCRFALSREKLPFVVTDVVSRCILRSKVTEFRLYIGWLFQNMAFRRFVKTLKKCGADYDNAHDFVTKTKCLIADISHIPDQNEDVSDEFASVSFEKFVKRDRKFIYSNHGAVLTPMLQRVGEYLLLITPEDEAVLAAAVIQTLVFFRWLPYVGKWRWVNDLCSTGYDRISGLRFEIRNQLSTGFHVYADNMMRTAKTYGAFDIMGEWSDAEHSLAQVLGVSPDERNKKVIADKWHHFVEGVNKAGQHTFIAMVSAEGFKLCQKDYIDVSEDDSEVVASFSVGLVNKIAFDKDIVLVEGSTDEDYFCSAIEAFDMNLPFKYMWVGHIDDNGRESFSGEGSLKNAMGFVQGKDFGVRFVIQYDCDMPHAEKVYDKIIVRSVAKYKNNRDCKKGTENALVLDEIDEEIWDGFFERKEINNDYGKAGERFDLKKSELCKYVCSLPKDKRKKIFRNLKVEIEAVAKLLAQHDTGTRHG